MLILIGLINRLQSVFAYARPEPLTKTQYASNNITERLFTGTVDQTFLDQLAEDH